MNTIFVFPGGALMGRDAGFLNVSRIKGSHAAIKTGMLAGEAAYAAVAAGRRHDELTAYPEAFEASWLYTELKKDRNFKNWFRRPERGDLDERVRTTRAARPHALDAASSPARSRVSQGRQRVRTDRLPQAGRQADVRPPVERIRRQHDEAHGGKRLQINAQNCVQCKTCDIKDPSQNIVWIAPEGGGGPNYSGM